MLRAVPVLVIDSLNVHIVVFGVWIVYPVCTLCYLKIIKSGIYALIKAERC